MRVARKEGKEERDLAAHGRIRSLARKAREAACVDAAEGGDALRREKILGADAVSDSRGRSRSRGRVDVGGREKGIRRSQILEQ